MIFYIHATFSYMPKKLKIKEINDLHLFDLFDLF